MAKANVVMLPLSQLVETENARKVFDDIEGLAASIKAQGVLQPILVRAKGKKFEVLAGRRRVRAAKVAGLKDVPCIVKVVDDGAAEEIAAVENIQRDDLKPHELLRQIALLHEAKPDASPDDIAASLGLTGTYARQLLAATSVSPKILSGVEAGKFTLGAAVAFARIPTHKAQEAVAKEMDRWGRSDGIGYSDVMRVVRNTSMSLDKPPFDKASDPPCNKCPKRTDSQAALRLEDKEAATVFCLDKGCFTQKMVNAMSVRTEAYTAIGCTILPNRPKLNDGRTYDRRLDIVDAQTKGFAAKRAKKCATCPKRLIYIEGNAEEHDFGTAYEICNDVECLAKLADRPWLVRKEKGAADSGVKDQRKDSLTKNVAAHVHPVLVKQIQPILDAAHGSQAQETPEATHLVACLRVLAAIESAPHMPGGAELVYEELEIPKVSAYAFNRGLVFKKLMELQTWQVYALLDKYTLYLLYKVWPNAWCAEVGELLGIDWSLVAFVDEAFLNMLRRPELVEFVKKTKLDLEVSPDGKKKDTVKAIADKIAALKMVGPFVPAIKEQLTGKSK